MLWKIRWTSIIKIWLTASYSLNTSNEILHRKHTSILYKHTLCTFQSRKDNRKKGVRRRKQSEGKLFLWIITFHWYPHIKSSILTTTHCVIQNNLLFNTFQPWSFYEGNRNTSQWGMMSVLWSAKHINRTNCLSVWQRFLYLKSIPGHRNRTFPFI